MYNSENVVLKLIYENKIWMIFFFIAETPIILMFLLKLLKPHFLKHKKNLHIFIILGFVIYLSIMLPTLIFLYNINVFEKSGFDFISIDASDIAEFIVILFSLKNIYNLFISRKNDKDYILISVIHNTFFSTNIIFKFLIELKCKNTPYYYSVLILLISLLIIFANDFFEKPFEYCRLNNGFIKRSHLSMLVISDFFIIILTTILLYNIFSFYYVFVYISFILLYLLVLLSVIMNLEYDEKINENKELVCLKFYLKEKLNLISYSTQNLLKSLYNIMK